MERACPMLIIFLKIRTPTIRVVAIIPTTDFASAIYWVLILVLVNKANQSSKPNSAGRMIEGTKINLECEDKLRLRLVQRVDAIIHTTGFASAIYWVLILVLVLVK